MSAVRKLARREATLEVGWLEHSGKTLTVRLGTERYEAERAKGCLVAPEEGDRVLCAVDHDAVFVLTVLQGQQDGRTRLSADGTLELQAPAGRIQLCSGHGVDIVGAQDIALSSSAVHVRAQTGSVAVDELGYFGRLVHAEVSRVAVLAQQLDATIDRWVQRTKRAFRFVEQLEQVRAGSMDLRAETMAAVRGQTTIVAARGLAKIDGEQVHIG